MSEPVSRRALLRGGVIGGVVIFAGPRGFLRPIALATGIDGPTFLTDEERATLEAVVDTIVPADVDPGALAAGCAEAIDGLLGAFLVTPPRIYAGGPFSDRAGAATNDFERFIALDAYEERGWRLRVTGSGGDPALEFNGPVVGYQQLYRDGLAACEAAAAPAGFATLPQQARELILRSDDPAIAAMMQVAAPHTNEFLYGPPEYGGNQGLVGWASIRWMGDVQPRGFTDDEVTDPDIDPTPSPLPAGVTDLLPLAGLATAEQAWRTAPSGTVTMRDAEAVAARARAAVAAYQAARDGEA